MTNGKGTFHAIKRELAMGQRVGRIQTTNDLIVLHGLLHGEMMALNEQVTHWMQEETKINNALDDLGAERDSRVEMHGQHAANLLIEMRARMISVYRRDLNLIEAFLKARGISAS